MVVVVVVVAGGRVSLCSTGSPGTHAEDQVVLELRDPLAFASQVLNFKGMHPYVQLHLLNKLTKKNP